MAKKEIFIHSCQIQLTINMALPHLANHMNSASYPRFSVAFWNRWTLDLDFW